MCWQLLRGFPTDLIRKIREQPSGALLATMLKRQKSFSPKDFGLQRLKGEYLASRLPPSLDVVGSKAAINNYWLFPVVAVSIVNSFIVPLYAYVSILHGDTTVRCQLWNLLWTSHVWYSTFIVGQFFVK